MEQEANPVGVVKEGFPEKVPFGISFAGHNRSWFGEIHAAETKQCIPVRRYSLGKGNVTKEGMLY